MAKAAKKLVDISLLGLIAAASAQNQDYGVTKDEATPLLEKNLIVVDTARVDNATGKAPARITDVGTAMLNQPNANPAPASNGEAVSAYPIIKGAVLPPSKRGAGLKGAGAPKQYQFDTMEIGDTFFVPVSAKHPDPVKSLGSAVSSANMRFSEKTGEMKTVNRVQRGHDHKAVVDGNGNKVYEQVQVPVRKPTRKFAVRAVSKGDVLGSFTAPENGAIVGRVE